MASQTSTCPLRKLPRALRQRRAADRAAARAAESRAADSREPSRSRSPHKVQAAKRAGSAAQRAGSAAQRAAEHVEHAEQAAAHAERLQAIPATPAAAAAVLPTTPAAALANSGASGSISAPPPAASACHGGDPPDASASSIRNAWNRKESSSARSPRQDFRQAALANGHSARMTGSIIWCDACGNHAERLIRALSQPCVG